MSTFDETADSRTMAVGRKRRAPHQLSGYETTAEARIDIRGESETDSDIDRRHHKIRHAGSSSPESANHSGRRSTPKQRRRKSSVESGEISTSSVSSRESGQLSETSERPSLGQDRHSPHHDNGTSSSSDDETDSSSGESDSDSGSDSASMSISSGSDEAGANSDYPHDSTELGPRRLRDVHEDEQMLQFRYFRLTNEHALVYCLCCGARGHISASCPKRHCPHCDATDSHSPEACPTVRRCAHCREPGHDAARCPNPRHRGPVTCDICLEDHHVEEECSRLWCVQVQRTYDGVRQIESDSMHRVCYRCGASGPDAHWGDDCPMYGRTANTSSDLNLNTTWSAKHANHFIITKEENLLPPLSSKTSPPEEQLRDKGSNWQMSLLDSLLDDQRD